MERNTITTISELQAGDRFYLPKDKKKIVYEMLYEGYYNRINAYGYKMLAHSIHANPNTEVIFLRNTNENQ